MMHRITGFFISSLAAAGMCLLSAGGVYEPLAGQLTRVSDSDRMKNVTVVSDLRQESAQPAAAPAPAPRTEALSGTFAAEPETAATMVTVIADGGGENVLETTIEGGLRIKNETDYWVDAAQLLSQGPQLTLPADDAQILIIHTHSSEAYTQAGLDRYEASDTVRTEDTQFNIVRIGDELTDILTDAGLKVIHDRGIYDYPSYTGSYTRSGEAVQQYLDSFPSLAIVLDIHRDALSSESVVYKTMAEEEGVVASQVMLLVGTDGSGLEHPGWRRNLSLAVYLQNAVNLVNPTLMRPVSLVQQRYNQHMTPGSLIVEVGSSGNTLQEALAAIRLFGNAVAPALLELTE